MAFDVFISYSHQNKVVADAICAKLEQNHIRCWYAPRDIDYGDVWAQAISKAINSARLFTIIVTKESIKSNQVLNEIALATSAGIPIIPFKLTNKTLSDAMQYYLTSVHWLDAVDKPLQDAINELYLTIDNVLNGRLTSKHSSGAVPSSEPTIESVSKATSATIEQLSKTSLKPKVRKAVKEYLEEKKKLEEKVKADPDNLKLIEDLSTHIYFELDRFAEEGMYDFAISETLYNQQLLLKLLPKDPPTYMFILSNTFKSLTELYGETEQYKEAEVAMRQCREIDQKRFETEPTEDHAADLLETDSLLIEILLENEHYGEIKPLVEELMDFCSQDIFIKSTESDELRKMQADAWHALGEACAKLGDIPGMEKALAEEEKLL